MKTVWIAFLFGLQIVAVLSWPQNLMHHIRQKADKKPLTPSFPFDFIPFRPPSHLDGVKPEKPPLRYDVTLDQGRMLHLYWDIDLVTSNITFKLKAKVGSMDYVGFGFSDYGETENADVVLIWTDQQGRHHFTDSHTDSGSVLHTDRTQSYQLHDVSTTRDAVYFTFSRKFDTCDDDDYLIDAGTTHIIFFAGKGPLYSSEGLDVSLLEPGLQRVQLIKSQQPDAHFPPDTRKFNVHVTKVPVPSEETTYWCQTRKLPPMPEKHHIIKFGGYIDPASVGLVHHLEVFHCEVPPDVHVPYYSGLCKDPNRPKLLDRCMKVIGAWAMGAKPLTLPEEAGYPIGGPGYSRYVRIEVHYNNVEKASGRIDNSGLTFYVTPTLRKYDAGVMEIGLEYTDKMALPPGQRIWPLKGYCIPSCTDVALPEWGIQIFASQLHTHLTGKKVYTKHFRNGIELPELNRDNHYSPHYQEIRRLPRNIHVLPNDSLVTVCEDSTLDRKEITLGGFAIREEMCVNYMHYYPKSDLEVCKSSINTEALEGFFEFMHRGSHQPTSPELGISDNYRAIEWTPVHVHMLQTLYDTAPLSMQCNQSDGHRFPGNWEGVAIPEVTHAMPPTERPCLI